MLCSHRDRDWENDNLICREKDGNGKRNGKNAKDDGRQRMVGGNKLISFRSFNPRVRLFLRYQAAYIHENHFAKVVPLFSSYVLTFPNVLNFGLEVL